MKLALYFGRIGVLTAPMPLSLLIAMTTLTIAPHACHRHREWAFIKKLADVPNCEWLLYWGLMR